MRIKGLSFATLAALSILLAGCGQRGPLYLPDNPPPKKRLSQQASPSVPAWLIERLASAARS